MHNMYTQNSHQLQNYRGWGDAAEGGKDTSGSQSPRSAAMGTARALAEGTAVPRRHCEATALAQLVPLDLSVLRRYADLLRHRGSPHRCVAVVSSFCVCLVEAHTCEL
jgi:hypothetical protein